MKPLKTWLKALLSAGVLDLDVQWPNDPVYPCVAFAALDHKKEAMYWSAPTLTVSSFLRQLWGIFTVFAGK